MIVISRCLWVQSLLKHQDKYSKENSLQVIIAYYEHLQLFANVYIRDTRG